MKQILEPKPFWHQTLSEYITAIAWSQQGKALAIATAAGEVSLWQEGKLVTLQAPNARSIDCLGFSADGCWLAAAGQSGMLRIWNLTSDLATNLETPAHSLTQGEAWIDRLVWHPERSEFAFSLGKYVQIWSAERQDIVATVNFDASTVLAIAWDPDGEWLTVGGYQGIKVWRSTDWYDDPVSFAMPTATGVIAWDPSGRFLAANTMDRTVALIEWLDDSFDETPWRMQGFPGKVRAFAWSMLHPKRPEALLVSCSGTDVVVWSKHDDPEIGWAGAVLQGHAGIVGHVMFQPGSDLLASAGDDGLICLWQNAQTLSQTLKNAQSEVTCLQWHPQGNKLAIGTARGGVYIWGESTRGSGFGRR